MKQCTMVRTILTIGLAAALIIQAGCIPKFGRSSSQLQSGRGDMTFEDICKYTWGNLNKPEDYQPEESSRVSLADFKLTKALIKYIHILQGLHARFETMWDCNHSQLIEGHRQFRWPLDLSKSGISDISILPIMENVQWAKFADNMLDDSAINQFGKLFPDARGVNIAGNTLIKTCGPLKSLKHLAYANIAGTAITNLEGCFEKNRHPDRPPLSYIDISLTSISKENFEAFILEHGKSLIGLRMFRVRGVDSLNLDLLPRLKALDISDTNFREITASKAHSLEYLDARGTRIGVLPDQVRVSYLLTARASHIDKQSNLLGLGFSDPLQEFHNQGFDRTVIEKLTELKFAEVINSDFNGKERKQAVWTNGVWETEIRDGNGPYNFSFLHTNLPQEQESTMLLSSKTMAQFEYAYTKIFKTALNTPEWFK